MAQGLFRLGHSSCGPAALGLEVKTRPGTRTPPGPPGPRYIPSALRLPGRHDDSDSLSPRALLGILLPGLVWLVYYLAAYSARSRPAMPAGTCPEPISPYIPPYLSIRIFGLRYLQYGTANFRILQHYDTRFCILYGSRTMPGTKGLSPVILLCIARAAAAPRPPEALATSSLVVLTAARGAAAVAERAIPPASRASTSNRCQAKRYGGHSDFTLPERLRPHAPTQWHFFMLLKRFAWRSAEQLTFVDLGAMAAAGHNSNESDATLWLTQSAFGAFPGSVLAVDAVPGSVQVVQSLLESRSRGRHRVKAVLGAVSNTDGLDLDFSAHELIADMVCQCYYAGNKLRYQMKLRKLRQYQSERSTTCNTHPRIPRLCYKSTF